MQYLNTSSTSITTLWQYRLLPQIGLAEDELAASVATLQSICDILEVGIMEENWSCQCENYSFSIDNYISQCDNCISHIRIVFLNVKL